MTNEPTNTRQEVGAFIGTAAASLAPVSPEIFSIPSTPVTDSISRSMIYRSNLDRMPIPIGKEPKRWPIKQEEFIDKDGNIFREITFTGEDGETIISIPVDCWRKGGAMMGKIWLLFLQKMNLLEELPANDPGELSSRTIRFPLAELVQLGIAGDEQQARNEFNKFAKAVRPLYVGHTFREKKGKKGKFIQDSINIFSTVQIRNTVCNLVLNHDLDRRIFTRFYSILPTFLLKLSERTTELGRYIFYIARQNPAARAGNTFYISLKTLADRLGLPKSIPDPDRKGKYLKRVSNPQRDIRDPLTESIRELKAALAERGEADLCKLELIVDDDSNIEAFLESGRLAVTLTGQYLDQFTKLDEKQQKRLERKARINEKAETAALEKYKLKKLEEQELEKTATSRKD
jgi:hypothetical protein